MNSGLLEILKNLQYNDEKKGPLGERAFKTAWKTKQKSESKKVVNAKNLPFFQ